MYLTSIINYFDKGLSWETFVKGFFIINTFIIIFFFMMYLLPKYHKKDELFLNFYFRKSKEKMQKFYSLDESSISGKDPLPKKSNAYLDLIIKVTQFFSLGGVFTVSSFVAGIIFSNVSDIFMDQGDRYHLGMKKNWCNYNLENTDGDIKFAVFNKMFHGAITEESVSKVLHLHPDFYLYGTGETCEEKREAVIQEVYYQQKHKMLENDWRDYIETTQIFINLNQTFCFATIFLYAFSLIGFLITLGISIGKYEFSSQQIVEGKAKHSALELFYLSFFAVFLVLNIFYKLPYASIALPTFCALTIVLMQFGQIHGHRLNSCLILIMFSLFLYHVSAIAWQTCEDEGCRKVFGLLIYEDEALSKQIQQVFKEMLVN